MKNRKHVVVAFLLVAAMLLGVGYAALSDTLYVNGTLSVSAEDVQDTFEKEVYFKDAAKDSSSTGTGATADTITIEADTDGDVNDAVTFTVNSLKVVGEKAIFTFKIQNDNDFAVTATPSANFTNAYFAVTGPVAVDVSANGSADVTVTVELKAIPTDGSAQTVTYALTYNVVPKA